MTSRKLRKKDDLYFNEFYISPFFILIVDVVDELRNNERKVSLYSIDSRIEDE
jgi:hypothetical protein